MDTDPPRPLTPRLLVIVTLAEAGGAQTFAATLVAGLRERYEVEVAAHGPRSAGRRLRGARTCPFHHVRHLVRDPHPLPRRRSRARAARAGARGSRRTSCRSTRPRPACWPGSRSPAWDARRSSPRTAGRSRAAAAPRAPSTRPPSARLRRSPTRSCASRATTCSSRTSAASRRAASLHVIHNGVDAPAALPPRRPPGEPPRARLHRAARAAEGPDHAAGRARPAGLRALGAARVRRRPRPRGDRAASRCARPGRSRDAARPPQRRPGAARRLRRVRADQRLGGPAVLDPRGDGRRPAGARDARRRHPRPRRARLDGRARAAARCRRGRRACSQPGPPIPRPC